MNQELPLRLFAHISLVIYIAMLIWLLFYLKRMVRNQTDKYVYASLCFWLLLATKDIAYFFGDTWYDVEVTNTLMSFDLWPTPIISIILLHILQPKWLNLWRIACMTAPFFVFTMLCIITKGNELIFVINQVYGLIYSTLLGIIIFVLTFKCDRYINANYSEKGQINIVWVRYSTIAMYAICIIWFFFSTQTTWLTDALYYLSTTALVTMIFYYSLSHKEVMFPNYIGDKDATEMDNAEKFNLESTIVAQRYAQIEAALVVAIERDKIYRNPQLSLGDLANHIGTNRTYLSRYINSYLATPFINYINDFRVRDAYSLMKEPTNTHSIIEISEQCGFASYSTFKRVFKAKYGCAPSRCRD